MSTKIDFKKLMEEKLEEAANDGAIGSLYSMDSNAYDFIEANLRKIPIKPKK